VTAAFLHAEVRRGKLRALKIGGGVSPFSGRLVVPQAAVERYIRDELAVAASFGSRPLECLK
jgi:hypothetical protein